MCSDKHFFERKPFGRQCLPRKAPVTACYDVLYLFRLDLALANIKQRARDDPDHVIEKSFA